MRRVDWTIDAIRDLQRVESYIERFNPSAARHLAASLIEATKRLESFAERGRPVKGNSRELVTVWPYVIRYRIDEQAVVILRVRHGARRPP